MSEAILSDLSNQAQELVGQVIDHEKAREFWRDNPYLVLGVAASVGYIAAGGLATPFTRRLIRIGMKALFVPVAASRLKSLATSIPEQEHE